MSQPTVEPLTLALPPAVFRHWIHSREEDAGGLEVYRPDGFPFPPSFGRDGFEMFQDGDQDGRFVQDDVGPADGIVQTEGRWELVAPLRVAVSFPGTDRPGYSFEVIEADRHILRLRKGPAVDDPYGYAECPAMEEHHMAAYDALPQATTSKRLDFERAQILALRIFPPRFILRVSGTKPYANMDVALVPFVYIQQPEYWEIEVVGTLQGVAVPMPTPYSVSMRLDGILGTRGIEVVGATRRQRFDVPERPSQQGRCFDWSAFVNRQPPEPPRLIVTGTCEFPTAGFTVELRRHEPQGINPRDLLLDKVVTAPTGPVAQVVTQVEARFEEETSTGFDTVTILPDGPTIPVTIAV
jgi:hypothetical protein